MNEQERKRFLNLPESLRANAAGLHYDSRNHAWAIMSEDLPLLITEGAAEAIAGFAMLTSLRQNDFQNLLSACEVISSARRAT